MSSESSWNQTRIPFQPPFNPSPAVLNWRDRSTPFMPCSLPRNEFNMTRDVCSQNQQMPKYEFGGNTVQSTFPAISHIPGRESRMIQGPYHVANQPLVNGPNITHDSNLLHQLSSNKTSVVKSFYPSIDRRFVNTPSGTKYLKTPSLTSEVAPTPTDRMLVIKSNRTTFIQHRLSSERAHVIQNFHPVAHQLSTNESNISPQSCSLSYRLPSTGISQNSNMFNQQLYEIKHPPTDVLSENEFRSDQSKYSLANHESERESILNQGSQSIFGRHFRDGLGLIENQSIPRQQSVGNKDSYPLASFPEMGFNKHQKLPEFDTNLYQNLFLQYSEKVYICVIGPPRCGKTDLIRTFTRNDSIRISTDRPLSWIAQKGMIEFGTTLEIKIWYGEDLTSTVEDVRSLCQSSKSAIVLVYSVAQRRTLSTALEWIEYFKSDINFNVPIILIGNTTETNTSREFQEITPNLDKFKDGVTAKDEYGLAEFYECSTKCVKDVEKIFLVAALVAFCRRIQKPVRGW